MTLHERVNAFSPGIKNWFTRHWYQYLAGLPHAEDLLFMNYGYTSETHPQPGLDPADEPYRLCIQLYHHTVAETPLAGKQVLEVGSGRGGGASYLARYRQPAQYTGLDFAPRAVAFCRKYHKASNLNFMTGTALQIPFADNSLDAVLNVESSHTYLSFAVFCREVFRVLKPGCWFLFTDLRDTDKAEAARTDLLQPGFTIAEEEDISREVLRAMELDHERKCRLIAAKTPFFLHTTLRQFAGTRESKVYTGLADGSVRYLRFKLQKPVK